MRKVGLSFGALLLILPRVAAAGQNGAEGIVYTPPNDSGSCVAALIGLEVGPNGDEIQIDGDAWEVPAPNCEVYNVGENVPNHGLSLSYALFYWNGSSAQVCGTDPGWPGAEYRGDYVTNADLQGLYGIELYTPAFFSGVFGAPAYSNVNVAGCGSGWYYVGANAQAWNGSEWVGGNIYTGWNYLTLTPPAPPK
jgi:hypothetical protein